MYTVFYSKQAEKFLEKADKTLASRILAKIETLQNQPVIHDTKTVHGYNEKLFRVRVGGYRILYTVDFVRKTIGVAKIDKRESVY